MPPYNRKSTNDSGKLKLKANKIDEIAVRASEDGRQRYI